MRLSELISALRGQCPEGDDPEVMFIDADGLELPVEDYSRDPGGPISALLGEAEE